MSVSHILFKRLEQASGARIGLLGGGGKTTLLFRMGTELASCHSRVLMTALTQAGPTTQFRVHLSETPTPSQVEQWFIRENPLYLLGRQLGPEKYQGFESRHLENILDRINICLIEADGARNRPLKVHNKRDPVLPSWITHAVIVIGAEVVQARLSETTVHRAHLFSRHWNIPLGTLLDPVFLSEILIHPKGYFSRLVHPVKRLFFINQADRYPSRAQELARALKVRTSDPIVVGSARKGQWEAWA